MWLFRALTLTALTMALAEPATAQQSPFLSLPDAARQVAKMTVCTELWNLFVAEAQTDTDSGGNLDLSSTLISIMYDVRSPESHQIEIKTGSSTSDRRDVCGSLIVAGPGSGPAIVSNSFAATTPKDALDVAGDYFNVSSVGGQFDDSMRQKSQQLITRYVNAVMAQLPRDLAAAGENASDLRIIAHAPVLTNTGVDPIAQHTDAALKALYPGP